MTPKSPLGSGLFERNGRWVAFSIGDPLLFLCPPFEGSCVLYGDALP